MLAFVATPLLAATLHHYIFFGFDRDRIEEKAFLETPVIEGAQLKFSWRELEPRPGEYDFQAVEAALSSLAAHGKRLWIQLQDASFDPGRILVPDYLRTDPGYHGGIAAQLAVDDSLDSNPRPAGWVARRWDPAVRARFALLVAALGRAFDGRIEGINLPESSLDFGETGRLYPPGFTPAAYRDGLIEMMGATRNAFPRSLVVQYLNFMPGEWLPDEDLGLLRSVFEFALSRQIGLGGPDLLPHRPGQMANGYSFLRLARGRLTIAVAVQEGNELAVDPTSGRVPTPARLAAFAHDELGATHIFWGAHPPFYGEQVLPYLVGLGTSSPSGRLTRSPLRLATPSRTPAPHASRPCGRGGSRPSSRSARHRASRRG